MMTRRLFLRAAGTCTGVMAGLGYYTWKIEPDWLEIVRRDLPIHRLPPRLAGRTLVQLSDLHVGRLVSDDYLLDTFTRIRSRRPDIVVITGDMISWPREALDHAARILAHVPRGRLATVATLGNHDYGHRWGETDVAQRVVELMQSCGVTVLRNQLLDVEGLQIVGFDDLWAERFNPGDVLPRMDTARAALALTHNPDTVDLPGWDGYEGWILAGHTHGGQCKPPFLPPPILPVKNKRYTSGEFELSGNRRLYINRGVGHVMPVRFNARPEATVFEMRRA